MDLYLYVYLYLYLCVKVSERVSRWWSVKHRLGHSCEFGEFAFLIAFVFVCGSVFVCLSVFVFVCESKVVVGKAQAAAY